jgi:DNA-binding CsgD family transcriptional regulator
VNDLNLAGRMYPDVPKIVLQGAGFGIALFDGSLELRAGNEMGLSVLAALGVGHSPPLSPEQACVRERWYSQAHSAKNGVASLTFFAFKQSLLGLAFSPFTFADVRLGPGVLMTTERSALCDPISIRGYGESSGLTKAEVRVLESLAEGLEPKEIASTFGVSVSTVRSHIQAVLQKTYSGTLRELILKLAKLPPGNLATATTSFVLSGDLA